MLLLWGVLATDCSRSAWHRQHACGGRENSALASCSAGCSVRGLCLSNLADGDDILDMLVAQQAFPLGMGHHWAVATELL